MDPVLAIVRRETWEEARFAGELRTPSLETEGFIHLSLPWQVVAVANRVYPGTLGLVLLVIDPGRLTAELRYETAKNGDDYPHLYGPLNASAVLEALNFPPGPDGRFALPEKLA